MTYQFDQAINKRKWKFFSVRFLTYFSFLLLPIGIQKAVELNFFAHLLLVTFYIIFICTQWFLLAKEVDHRLKIYTKTNSSLDRVIYRLLLGGCMMMIYFNVLAFTPEDTLKHFYWGTWILLGFFYSWPTRGKIIEESVSSDFNEFKFLDGFEKTVLLTIVAFLLVSLPKLPTFDNIEALKLYLDPNELLHDVFWTFMHVNYFPFLKYPKLLNLAYCLHLYILGMGLCLLVTYSILRFFYSRKLSLLGILAFISSWSVSKILGQDFLSVMTTTFCLTWIWSMMWAIRSASYRSGLLIGFIPFLGILVNGQYYFLVLINFILVRFVFFKNNKWFARQMMKYMYVGTIFSLALIFSHHNLDWSIFGKMNLNFIFQFSSIISQKSFYLLSIIGVIFLLKDKKLNVELNHFNLELLWLLFIALLYSIFLSADFYSHFSIMGTLIFLSLIPLDRIFQVINVHHSKRNLIYVVYVLVCVLDSHFEGRVKLIMSNWK